MTEAERRALLHQELDRYLDILLRLGSSGWLHLHFRAGKILRWETDTHTETRPWRGEKAKAG